MNPSRPTRFFTALAAATLALSFAGVRDGDAQQTTTSFGSTEPSAEPATTAIAATPMPDVTPTAHVLRPVIFVRPTPWKYAPLSPVAKRRDKAKRGTKADFRAADVAPSPTPRATALRTLSPSGAIEPSGGAAAEAQAVSPATPSQAAPRTKPSAAPTPLPADDGAPQVFPPANDVTPIPTQPPTPRPLAPSQPSIPDSMSDPNVRGIIARPIRQLSQIGWMQGTWGVKGVTNKEDGTTVPLDPTTYVFSPIMDNRWMFGADGKAADYIYLTFDPFARHWVALRFGSNPSYGMWVSERGWVGNRIDFITNFSYVNGRQYRRRLTIIHKDARTFGIYETEQTPDGSFIPDDAYEFKKL